MANTLYLTSSMRGVMGTQTTTNEGQKSQTATITGTDKADITQDIPTTAGGTAVAFPSAMGSLGWAMVENLDPTNYVELGRQVSGSFYPLLKVSAGKKGGPFEFGCSTSQLYALANAGTVKLRIIAHET